jgi:hypothetical protein
MPIQVKPERDGRVSIRIRVRPAYRWVAVSAFTDSAKSPKVLVRIHRPARERR